jgi:two-component sensor histidine kinase
MGTDEREGLDRESAALLREVGRLRSLLQQAGIEAEQSSREISESERRYTRDIEGERAKTQTARADADELRHRLKNTLAVVQAIAKATLRPDVSLEDARAAFSARLQALADAHDILFESNWDSVGLQTIIDGILAPHRGGGLNRIRVRGPDVSLEAKPALALGLALHELGTNAAKYGALSNDEGYVDIAWILAPIPQGQELRLRWHERNGPPVLPPTRTGFGTRLIEKNLAAEFDGAVELDYRPDGFVCTICAPVEGLTVSQAD